MSLYGSIVCSKAYGKGGGLRLGYGFDGSGFRVEIGAWEREE